MRQNQLGARSAATDIHKENIKRNIEHRLQVAKSRGDERLIQQLEAEMRYFA
ncbi:MULTISPECIES: hypothetical protein [unclassified Anabaena]|uniref:arginine synthesis PII-interacting regulator PirA n=1 Tax=unclassified Anabaena TaxID=2619674 RepID=UPI000A6351B4|nr:MULTISPECIES: hypothetical protein [unclassified Anabaena]